MNVNFYRAADAFLYLPTYIAEYRGIYEQIDRNLKVSFDTPERPNSGDLPALRAMLTDSKKGDSLPIAICDPFVLFGGGLRDLNVDPTDLRVLGAIITKVPFWAVDSRDGEIPEEDFGRQFKRIIYYNEKLRTGHYIGARTAHRAGIPDIQPVYFGQEFEELFRHRRTADTLAVTCDIVSMGLFHNSPDSQRKISVNHCYANNSHYTNFLTTALITTDEACKKYPAYTVDILQGIQASLAILRSSKEIALSVCVELAEADEFYGPQHIEGGKLQKLKNEQVEWIIDRIYEGDFYPSTLEISRKQWEETLESHAIGYGFARESFEKGKAQYDVIVNPDYLFEAQRKYLRSAGVSLSRLVEIEMVVQESTIDQLIAKKQQETLVSQRPSFYQRIVSQVMSFAGAIMALLLCLVPAYNNLPTVILASLLVVSYPAYLVGSWLRRNVKILNSLTILWLWTFVCVGLSAFFFYKGYFLSNDSVRSNMMFVLSGLSANVAAVPFSILLSMYVTPKLKPKDEK